MEGNGWKFRQPVFRQQSGLFKVVARHSKVSVGVSDPLVKGVSDNEKPQALYFISLYEFPFDKFAYIVIGNVAEGKELPLQASPAESVINDITDLCLFGSQFFHTLPPHALTK